MRTPATAVGCLLVALCGRAEAGGIDRLVVFGNSLTDTGNVSILTFGIVPGSPYWEGRFSNGPVWIETLAGQLGTPAPVPSRDGGTNYAHGGAESGNGFTSFIVPNIGTQVGDYLGDGLPPAPGDLFVVFGGANDFINGETDPTVVVDNLISRIETLAVAGAERFLVFNLLPLGQAPRFVGTPDESLMDGLAAEFNLEYDTALAVTAASLGVDILRFDFAALADEILSDPAAFGFVNVTEPAYDEPSGTIVPNEDEYLFWDDLHPTRVAHELLGLRVHEEIAGPRPVPGDVDGDGLVNVLDLVEIIVQWGACPDPPTPCPADLTGDGEVGVVDLVLVVTNWS